MTLFYRIEKNEYGIDDSWLSIDVFDVFQDVEGEEWSLIKVQNLDLISGFTYEFKLVKKEDEEHKYVGSFVAIGEFSFSS